jgi:HD-GYP domain-containing protein (c-di-GMP phosphodiesterase class II)
VWAPVGGAGLERPDGEPGLPALQRDAVAVDAALGGGRRHAADVARVAVALAVQLDWPAHRQAELHRAARLHDVGKVALLPDVLQHPDALSAVQLDHIRQHPRIGAEMAAPALDPEPVSWIRHHHERWDGSGYPDALAGDAIPEGAQLLAIGDAFAAMTTDRPYRLAMPADLALAEVERCAGTHFRPDAGTLLRAALSWLAGPA